MAPHCWSWVLDHLVAANRVSRISQEIEDLGGIKVHRFSTSSSGITYSGSICCSRGPRAFLNTCVFHIPHQVLKPINEEVKDKSAGIGIWRSLNPVPCKWVKQQGLVKGFDFDVTKAEQIFDLLL